MRASARRATRRLAAYVAIAVLSLLVLLGAGVAVTQTGWFKNWLRQKAVSQAAQYLNGELTITRLGGNLFTGVALEGVALRHEGQTVVAMDRLIVQYSPLTMISQGVILDSMTLDNATILLQRDDAGWNFRRFVKTRRNTGGRGAPPITMQSIAMNNSHVIVKDRDRLVEDLTRLNTRFRFAYEKPGVAVSIGEFSAHAVETSVRSLAGDLRFDQRLDCGAQSGDGDRSQHVRDRRSPTVARRIGGSTCGSMPNACRFRRSDAISGRSRPSVSSPPSTSSRAAHSTRST